MKTVFKLIAAIGTNGCPESHLYILLGMDLSAWNRYKTAMVNSGLITCGGHFVRLTSVGESCYKSLMEIANN